MPAWVKRLRAMVTNPHGHSYADAARVLDACRFAPPRRPSGSHRCWRHQSGVRCVLVEAGHGTLRSEYIKDMIRAIEAAGEMPTLITEGDAT